MCAPPWLCNAAKAACHAMLLAGCEPNEISTYACQPSGPRVRARGGQPASQPRLHRVVIMLPVSRSQAKPFPPLPLPRPHLRHAFLPFPPPKPF